MKLGITFYRFGILGFLFAPGVLLGEPLKTLLAQHLDVDDLSPALRFPRLGWFHHADHDRRRINPPIPVARLLNGLSALTLFWLILWCVMWSGLDAKAGNQADLVVKYLGIIGVLGPLSRSGDLLLGLENGRSFPADPVVPDGDRLEREFHEHDEPAFGSCHGTLEGPWYRRFAGDVRDLSDHGRP